MDISKLFADSDNIDAYNESSENSCYRKVKDKMKEFYNRHKIAFKLLIFFIFYAINAHVMHQYEGWGYIECVYFITVSIFTVGYGYFVPTTDASKLYVVFCIIIPGVTLIVALCTTFARYVLQNAHDEIIYQYFRLRRFPRPNDKDMRHNRTVLSIILVTIWMIVGALIFSGNEGWTFIDGFYWSVVTMTTVGYGDKRVLKESTRAFGILYIYVAALTFAVAFNNAVDDYTAGVQRGELRKRLQQLAEHYFDVGWIKRLLTPQDTLKNINTIPLQDSEQHPVCSKERFILFTLTELGILDFSTDILPLAKKFDDMDVNKKGVLTEQELQNFVSHIQVISKLAQMTSISVEEISVSKTNITTLNPLHFHSHTPIDSDETDHTLSQRLHHHHSQGDQNIKVTDIATTAYPSSTSMNTSTKGKSGYYDMIMNSPNKSNTATSSSTTTTQQSTNTYKPASKSDDEYLDVTL